MSSYFKYDNTNYEIPSDAALSQGCTCETTDARMYDGTRSSQSITRFIRSQPSTYSLQFVIYAQENNDILQRLTQYENLVGKSCEFVYCEVSFGNVIISGIDASFTLDGCLGITSVSLGVNFQDNIIYTGTGEKLNIILK